MGEHMTNEQPKLDLEGLTSDVWGAFYDVEERSVVPAIRWQALQRALEALIARVQEGEEKGSSQSQPVLSPKSDTATPSLGGWRDISSAPKDGTIILLHKNGSRETVAGWWLRPDSAYEWAFIDETSGGSHQSIEPNAWVRWHGPTHWMPLPQGPADLLGAQRSELSGQLRDEQPPSPSTPKAGDEITEDALLTRAKGLIATKGWKPGDKFSAWSVAQLMVAFGMELTRQPETARCAYPDCGCDADAVCNAALSTLTAEGADIECHGLDTPERVCFYEQDFYVLSNFSSFAVWWRGLLFPTSEHAYHWAKFTGGSGYEDIDLQRVQARHLIMNALSAHEAFKRAQDLKNLRHTDWDDQKVGIMREIIRAKAEQHEYVHRKLLATGDRELVENSWRDDFWGWGPNRDGQNMLGKLWMELRADLRANAEGDAR